MKKIVIGALLSCLFITGCSNGEVKKTKLEDTLVIGMECNYPPYNFTVMEEKEGAVAKEGSVGYANGYDVMIAKKIAEGLNKKLVIKQVAWDGLIPALNSGSIDMIVAGMSKTEERSNSVDFSTPYYKTEFVVLTNENSKYNGAKTLDDFKGAKVVGQKDTSYDAAICQLKGSLHQEPLSSVPLIVFSVKNGINDATIVEKAVAQSITSNAKGLKMISFENEKGFMETEDVKTTVSVAIKKGNQKLLDEVNSILSKIDDGQREELMLKSIEISK